MSGPNGDMTISMIQSILEENDINDEDFAAVNSMLDQINSYLDELEERNDRLNDKLHDLMESNRQAREEFRAKLDGNSVEQLTFPYKGEEKSSLDVEKKEEEKQEDKKQDENQETENQGPQMSGDCI